MNHGGTDRTHVKKKHNYKLCLHERGIISGGVYVEDVLESIDLSRKFYLFLKLLLC